MVRLWRILLDAMVLARVSFAVRQQSVMNLTVVGMAIITVPAVLDVATIFLSRSARWVKLQAVTRIVVKLPAVETATMQNHSETSFKPWTSGTAVVG